MRKLNRKQLKFSPGNCHSEVRPQTPAAIEPRCQNSPVNEDVSQIVNRTGKYYKPMCLQLITCQTMISLLKQAAILFCTKGERLGAGSNVTANQHSCTIKVSKTNSQALHRPQQVKKGKYQEIVSHFLSLSPANKQSETGGRTAAANGDKLAYFSFYNCCSSLKTVSVQFPWC